MGWIIAVVVLMVIVFFTGRFAYRNLHCDEALMKKVWACGYEEKQVKLPNGMCINYGEGSSKQETALLLLHGQGQAWEDYDKVLPALAENFHVYAVDCHGHGASGHDKERYRLKLMTEDFIWFIEHVIKKPCIVSGHSSGGVLAAAIAAGAPEQVSGAVLEDPPFFKVLPQEMQNTFVWHDSFLLAENFKNQAEEKNFYTYYFMHGVLWDLFGVAKKVLARAAGKRTKKHPGEPIKLWFVPHAMLRGLYYREKYDYAFGDTFYDGSWFEGMKQEEVLAGVKCPCIYLKAKTVYLTDRGLVYEDTKELREKNILCCANNDSDAARVKELISGCKMEITPTSNHLIHYKYPEQFVAAIQKVSH